MGSTRLPGKQIAPIEGLPLLQHVLHRISHAELLDGIIVAIPYEPNSMDLIASIQYSGYPVLVYPRDPKDLVGRYQYAAKLFGIDTIVRIPADNPCIDPAEIDRLISFYRELDQPVGPWLTTNLDQNVLGNGYPGGLGAEIYDSWFMHWLDNNVTDPELREHPHKWAMKEGRVRTIEAPAEIRRPNLRFDVNTEEDLEYIRGIYAALYPTNQDFTAKDIIDHLESRRLN
jgi:spore coat polysaccharide biosynthesis protein SpsF